MSKTELHPIVIFEGEKQIEYEKPQKALFLDRDGVIVEEQPSYLRTEHDIEFISKSLDAIKNICDMGVPVIVITNQSAVGRNIISVDQSIKINKAIMKRVKNEGGEIAAIYMCPHHPDDGCLCRKPLPNMALLAQENMNLDLASSYFVGDTIKDMKTAERAKVRSILVMTGHGVDEYEKLDSSNKDKYHIAHDLNEAVNEIITSFQRVN